MAPEATTRGAKGIQRFAEPGISRTPRAEQRLPRCCPIAATVAWRLPPLATFRSTRRQPKLQSGEVTKPFPPSRRRNRVCPFQLASRKAGPLPTVPAARYQVPPQRVWNTESCLERRCYRVLRREAVIQVTCARSLNHILRTPAHHGTLTRVSPTRMMLLDVSEEEAVRAVYSRLGKSLLSSGSIIRSGSDLSDWIANHLSTHMIWRF